MKKSTLKMAIVLLAFALIPITDYILGPGSHDVVNIFVAMAILMAFETNVLGEIIGADYSDLIPRCIKTVIGVVMLLGLVGLFRQTGWFSTGYFDDAIISQLPITPVDVSVLVIVGTSLYWAGGMAYSTVTKLVVVIGNISYGGLKRVGLFELEDDDKEVKK